MRIAFFGTPEFSVPSLDVCKAIGSIVAVVTQPDRPRGRGKKVVFSAVKERAISIGAPVLQPQRLRGGDFAGLLRSYAPDVAVVAAYGRILPPDVLAVPPFGCVNVHASILPRFRGAAPVQRAILAGDRTTGTSLMVLEEGLDTGAVFARATLTIGEEATGASLTAALAEQGAALLAEALAGFVAGALQPIPQSVQGVVLAPPVEKSEGRMDFSEDAQTLERKVRAFQPWPRTWIVTAKGPIQIRRAKVLGTASAPVGAVLAATAEGIDIACGFGTVLRVLEVQLPGGRSLAAADYLRGHPLAIGKRWDLPQDHEKVQSLSPVAREE